MSRELDVRYDALRKVASSRSVVSVGLSVFQRQSNGGRCSYVVDVYDILSRCLKDYTLDEDAYSFLLNHGFDFERQQTAGVPYNKSSEIVSVSLPNLHLMCLNRQVIEHEKDTLNCLFIALIKSKKPILFHNGFLDLMFMYENFYAALPYDFQSFVSNVFVMFPNGVFDTKYMAESLGSDISFLEYVFYDW